MATIAVPMLLYHDRIGVLTQGGELLVKQGDLSGQWADEYGPNWNLPALQAVSLG